MRLAARFTLALVLGILLVLGVNAAFRIRRELALFHADNRRDGVLLGRALARAMEHLWLDGGEDAAGKFIEDAAVREQSLRVRWLPFDARSEDLLIPADVYQPVSRGKEVAVRRKDGDTGEKFYTYVPVVIAGRQEGAIEIRESLAADETYIRETILQSLVATGALVVVCGAFAMGLGVWFVGRPIQRLVDQARRIGRGDLEVELDLRQSDELVELAREMNAMCRELRRAHEAVLREAAGRVATVEQLRHADRLKTVGAIASGIAHELGTPLNVVSGRAQLIVRENPPKQPPTSTLPSSSLRPAASRQSSANFSTMLDAGTLRDRPKILISSYYKR